MTTTTKPQFASGTIAQLAVAVLFFFAGFLATPVHAGDDTARFQGTWRATFPYNGQMITMVSIHEGSGFKNYVVLPNGNVPAGEGMFTAANGKYTTSSPQAKDSGTYRFIDDNTVICTNAAGLAATWKREKVSAARLGASPAQPVPAQPPPSTRPGIAPSEPSLVQPTPAQPAAATPAYVPDPNLPADTNAAIEAFNRKDYNTAWRDFMTAAQRGDSEAQAGIGAMLFHHINPPGTGYYAQCEKWLQLSANQGNAKGMSFLAQYYYATGVAIAGGINPGINNAPIPPALQKQAEERFALARQWYERAVAKGDGYAMGGLAIMLDAGIGGPRDTARAAELRAQLKQHSDPNFAKTMNNDPGQRAINASWQAGHYAEALQTARPLAEKGDAKAQALLGKAYYEGVGVPRDYRTALYWLNKSVAQNNADAMFILGLMYELARGVNQDINKAIGLFDRAASLGQRDAEMEAHGMRMAGEAAAQQARWAAACQRRGGVTDGPECLIGGYPVDPY